MLLDVLFGSPSKATRRVERDAEELLEIDVLESGCTLMVTAGAAGGGGGPGPPFWPPSSEEMSLMIGEVSDRDVLTGAAGGAGGGGGP